MMQAVFRHSGIANLLIVLPALLSAAAFGQATGNSAGQTLLGTPLLALRKLGLHEEARALVAEVTEGLDIIENHTYYRSVLFFNGSLTAEELQSNVDSLINFAIAMQHYFNGADELAIGLWRNIISTSAQGFWPAEAELLAAGVAPD